MLYNSYRPMQMYQNQAAVGLPKGDKPGFGNAIFMITPNQKATLNLVDMPMLQYRPSMYYWYYSDQYFNAKIGPKTLVKNEAAKMKREYVDEKHPLKFVATGSKKSIISQEHNLVVDLGRWMDLYFAYSYKTSAKMMCEKFVDFLKGKLMDPLFNTYKKHIMIDIAAWGSTSKEFILMNSKFLDNPINLLFYTIFKYPDMMIGFPEVDFIFINSASGQLLIVPSNLLNKRGYTQIKSKFKLFKNITFSVEEETGNGDTPEISVITTAKIEKEATAEIKQETKTAVISTVTHNLLGKGKTKPISDAEKIDDITDEIIEDEGDVQDDYTPFDTVGEDEAPKKDTAPPSPAGPTDDDAEFDAEMSAKIEKEVAEFIANNESELEDLSDDEIAKRAEKAIAAKIYKYAFMPPRTEAEEKYVNDMTKQQQSVIDELDYDDVKSKVITESKMDSVIRTTNPNIRTSKFVNFDRDYNEKKLEQDIDGAVAVLAKADFKVFVESKEVIDSSDSLNLKKTYIYNMIDEKKRKMKVKFDVPVLIDNNYIYINGSKKIIGHQFIMKPIVKVTPSDVMLVTWDNKITIARAGKFDTITAAIQSYLAKNITDFSVRYGNGYIKNKGFITTLDYDMYAKSFYQFTVSDVTYIFDVKQLLFVAKAAGCDVSKVDISKVVPVGFNKRTKTIFTVPHNTSFTKVLFDQFAPDDQASILKVKKKPKLITAEATILTKKSSTGKAIPVILFLYFCEGFAEIMKKAEIEHYFINDDEIKNYDPREYGFVQLKDCTLAWKRDPISNTMLMNSLYEFPIDLYSKDELEDKDTFTALISRYYTNQNVAYILDNFKNFFLDNAAKEMLHDHGYPTDLPSLMIVAVRMLSDNTYKPENSMHNARIRSNEVIANLVYNEVTDAYHKYRTTIHRKTPSAISLKQSGVIDKLLDDDTRLVDEFSVLNPVLEIEKSRAVTFKGIRGIQMDRAMTLARRGYDESMLGVIGISTSPDANVGVVRQLTLEPKITSTRGYIDVHGKAGVEDLNSSNLLTPAELLTPFGVQHDDPTRTSMAYKQTKYMLLVEDSDPVMIGNKVEAMVPYYTSDEFSVVAAEDGNVVEISNGWLVVQYKSGKYKSIDISNRIQKNAAAGFFVENKLETDLKVGDKFKANEVIAFNPKAFRKNDFDKGASMKIGVLTKVAVAPNWDIYEDSEPITDSLSNRLATIMVAEQPVILDTFTYVDRIVNIGAKVKTGDILIRFDKVESEDVQALLDGRRAEIKEAIIEDTQTTIKAKYTGEIIDIQMFSTVPTSEFDPSIQKLLKRYHREVNARNDVLEKYSNDGDMKYYKSGQIIKQTSEIIIPGKGGKIRGDYVNEGVKIVFYIRYKDVAAKGDKICHEFALKGIASHVIPKGQEPYSEFRPDEEVSSLIAPLAITARKTPSVFLAMFGNKLIIEAKRHLREYYFDKAPVPKMTPSIKKKITIS